MHDPAIAAWVGEQLLALRCADRGAGGGATTAVARAARLHAPAFVPEGRGGGDEDACRAARRALASSSRAPPLTRIAAVAATRDASSTLRWVATAPETPPAPPPRSLGCVRTARCTYAHAPNASAATLLAAARSTLEASTWFGLAHR